MKNIIRISHFMNPIILFCAIWILTTLFYFLNSSEYVEKSSVSSILYLLFLVYVVFIFGLPLKLRVPKFDLDGYQLSNSNIKVVCIVFLPLLIFEVINEVSYFGTFPFMASMSLSDDVDYNSVGAIFKFKHNIFVKANSIFLAAYFFFLYILSKKKIYLIGYIFIIAISLLYISRSTLLSIASLTFMIYMIKNTLKLKVVIHMLLTLIVIAYAFDKLYFIRNMGNQNFMLNTYEDLGFLDSVIRGLDGVFNYISSPLSNLLYNIDIGNFSYFEFRPSYLIRRFLPSDIAIFIFGTIDFNNTIYFPNNSNTFTTFPDIFFAFGLIGSVFFYLIFLGLVMKYTYYKLLSNPYKWLLIVIFVNHILIFSIFSSSLFNVVYYFPVVIAYLFPPLKKLKRILN